MTLQKNIFKNNANLYSVNLSYNNFTSLPPELFKFNKKMKRFEIVDNGDNFPYFRGPELVLPNDMFPDTLEVDLNNLIISNSVRLVTRGS